MNDKLEKSGEQKTDIYYDKYNMLKKKCSSIISKINTSKLKSLLSVELLFVHFSYIRESFTNYFDNKRICDHK